MADDPAEKADGLVPVAMTTDVARLTNAMIVVAEGQADLRT